MDPFATFVLALAALAALGRVVAAAGRSAGLSPRLVAVLQTLALG